MTTGRRRDDRTKGGRDEGFIAWEPPTVQPAEGSPDDAPYEAARTSERLANQVPDPWAERRSSRADEPGGQDLASDLEGFDENFLPLDAFLADLQQDALPRSIDPTLSPSATQPRPTSRLLLDDGSSLDELGEEVPDDWDANELQTDDELRGDEMPTTELDDPILAGLADSLEPEEPGPVYPSSTRFEPEEQGLVYPSSTRPGVVPSDVSPARPVAGRQESAAPRAEILRRVQPTEPRSQGAPTRVAVPRLLAQPGQAARARPEEQDIRPARGEGHIVSAGAPARSEDQESDRFGTSLVGARGPGLGESALAAATDGSLVGPARSGVSGIPPLDTPGEPLAGPDRSGPSAPSPAAVPDGSFAGPARSGLSGLPLAAAPDESLAGPAQSGVSGLAGISDASVSSWLMQARKGQPEGAGAMAGGDPRFEKLAEAILFVRRQLKELAKHVHEGQQVPSTEAVQRAAAFDRMGARLVQLEAEVARLTSLAARPSRMPEATRDHAIVGDPGISQSTSMPSRYHGSSGPSAAVQTDRDRSLQSDPGISQSTSMPVSRRGTSSSYAAVQADGRTGGYGSVEVLEKEGLAAALAIGPFPDAGTRPIDRLLRLLVQRGASDLHLTVGYAPMFRIAGDIEPLRYKRTRADDWHLMIEPICSRRVWDQYVATGDVDFAYEIPEAGRFRVNLFRQYRGEGAVFRVIPDKVMTIEQLGMPKQLHRIAKIAGGLVLVTGPTGSGKSTTLAALIHEINETQAYHIITLEDPIEFVHHNRRSIIHQREVGTHTRDFATGLRDAVREDPNLLLVGEMRDLETIRLALESAAKGLLVFATLHTNNASKTVERVVNVFPTEEQDTIRSVLADTVRAILAQQLVKRKDGGRVAALEILFGSPALSNLIRDGKTHQITNLIQTGRKEGMIAMDEALMQLVQKGVITADAAFEKAIDKNLFRDPDQARLEDEALSSAQAQQPALVSSGDGA